MAPSCFAFSKRTSRYLTGATQPRARCVSRPFPSLWHQDPVRRRILIAMNMDTVVGHVNRFVQLQNTEKLEACFDQENPIGSTAFMRTWYTTKPCAPTERSQVSHVVYDSVWEKAVSDLCEKDQCVLAWAKNDHLDFKVRYLYRGPAQRTNQRRQLRIS